MGRASRSRRTGGGQGGSGSGQGRVAWQPSGEADPSAVITIEPIPRTQAGIDSGTPVVCGVSWGNWSKIIPAESVLEMAERLMTAAAQADLLSVLMAERFDFPAHVVTGLIQDVINASGPQGTDELMALPVGSMQHRRAMVMVKLREVERQGTLTPAEARRMAVEWIQIANTSVADELYHEVLADLAGLDEQTRDNVARYVALLHAVRYDREEIRAAQVAELRAELGLPPEEESGPPEQSGEAA